MPWILYRPDTPLDNTDEVSGSNIITFMPIPATKK